MADRITTIRTDAYKRKVPQAGFASRPIKWSETGDLQLLDPKDRNALLEDERVALAREAADRARSILAPIEEQAYNLGAMGSDSDISTARADALLRLNPWLRYIIGDLAKARYDLMRGQEEHYNDKHYGWGEYWNPPPKADEYFGWGRNEEGKLVPVPSELAKTLEKENPSYYEHRKKPFYEYDEDKAFELVPLTKEEATKDNIPWYSSTNEYINALLANRLGEFNRREVYNLAQQAYGDYLAEATERGEITPEERDALLEKGSFYAPSVFEAGARNVFTPVSGAVTGDPELRKKTSDAELAGRYAADLGLGAATFLIPYGGAVRGAMISGRPAAPFIGGAMGGLANYALQRGVNEMYDELYGHGSDNQPIDLSDAAMHMGLGGLSGTMMGSNRLAGLSRVRRMMNPRTPSSVTMGDIESSLKATKKYPGTKGDIKRAEQAHATSAMDKYRKKFGKDAAMMVQGAPKLEAGGIPLATNLPGGEIKNLLEAPALKGLNLREGADMAPRMGSQFIVGDRYVPVLPKGLKPGKGSQTPQKIKKVTQPMFWKSGSDPEFVKQYAKEHPEFYNVDFSGEDLRGGLAQAAKGAQTRGSFESQFFTGEPMIFKDPEFSQLLRETSGIPVDDASRMKQTFLRDVLKKAKPGTLKNGKFEEATGQQKKVYEKGMSDYSRRAKQKTVTPDQFKAASKNTAGSMVKKAGTMAIAPILNNVVPVASNIGFGVQPIEYEE